MSNGMHHVAPASFFPTAKELSSGLQWFKEHPILAAAAATAVSVITYLNTAEDDELAVGNGVDDQELATTIEQRGVDDVQSPPVDTPSSPERRRGSSPTRVATGTTSGAHAPPTRRASAPTNTTERTTPPALRKPGSEGKMSPAAVSWVDEHGGSLTQVFEHLTTADDEDYDDALTRYPDLDGPLRSSSSSPTTLPRSRGRPPTPRRQRSHSGDDASASAEAEAATTSVTSPSTAVPHWMGALAQGGVQSPQPMGNGTPTGPHGERQNESPQWGWYVAITPPQDLVPGSSVSGSSGIPRAVVVPSSARAIAGVARGASNVNDKEQSAMRRSASGRIKAA